MRGHMMKIASSGFHIIYWRFGENLRTPPSSHPKIRRFFPVLHYKLSELNFTGPSILIRIACMIIHYRKINRVQFSVGKILLILCSYKTK